MLPSIEALRFIAFWTAASSIWLPIYAFEGGASSDHPDSAALSVEAIFLFLGIPTILTLHRMLLLPQWGRPSLATWLCINICVLCVSVLALFLLAFPELLTGTDLPDDQIEWMSSPDAWWFWALASVAASSGYGAALLWISDRTAATFLIFTVIAAFSSEAVIAICALPHEIGLPGQDDTVAILVIVVQTLGCAALAAAGIWIGSAKLNSMPRPPSSTVPS